MLELNIFCNAQLYIFVIINFKIQNFIHDLACKMGLLKKGIVARPGSSTFDYLHGKLGLYSHALQDIWLGPLNHLIRVQPDWKAEKK